MEKTGFLNYEAPQVEVVEVEVEKGFTVSGGTTLDEFGYGGQA